MDNLDDPSIPDDEADNCMSTVESFDSGKIMVISSNGNTMERIGAEIDTDDTEDNAITEYTAKEYLENNMIANSAVIISEDDIADSTEKLPLPRY